MLTQADRLADAALGRVCEDLRSKGYEFISSFEDEKLPSYLRRWQPDAVAIGPEETVVIEVKSSRITTGNRQLAALADEVAAHPGHRLLVVYAGDDGSSDIRPASAARSQIELAVGEVIAFIGHGQNRQAIVAAWSLVEAVARRLYVAERADMPDPQTPGGLVQRLAMDGYIDGDEARRLGSLIRARNMSLHGDLDVSVGDQDISFILDKVTELNAIDAG